MSDTHIARVLAEAEANHEAAQGNLTAANEALLTISQRIAECEQAQAVITEKRLSGAATEADTAEFAALNGDLASLRASLAEAETAAAARRAELDHVDFLVSDARGAWQRSLASERVRILRTRALELEMLLVQCLRELGTEAEAAGSRFVREWVPGADLRSAVIYGRKP